MDESAASRMLPVAFRAFQRFARVLGVSSVAFVAIQVVFVVLGVVFGVFELGFSSFCWSRLHFGRFGVPWATASSVRAVVRA